MWNQFLFPDIPMWLKWLKFDQKYVRWMVELARWLIIYCYGGDKISPIDTSWEPTMCQEQSPSYGWISEWSAHSGTWVRIQGFMSLVAGAASYLFPLTVFYIYFINCLTIVILFINITIILLNYFKNYFKMENFPKFINNNKFSHFLFHLSPPHTSVHRRQSLSTQ